MIEYTIYGPDGIDQATRDQMDKACELPIARKAALMPDAHLGYGLPIGGVLATKNAIIPYGVGMDIACRMRLTMIDDPTTYWSLRDNDPFTNSNVARLDKALEARTMFGMGCGFSRSGWLSHPVMDDPRWKEIPLLRTLKDNAWAQLGTSGCGNHFVEWGQVSINTDPMEPKIYGYEDTPRKYLGLLSHSGSRGTGAKICQHYTKIAKEQNPAGELSWLDLDSEEGQEYWIAMQLMGEYAAACHELIHERVLDHAGMEKLAYVENHHNFAWKEIVDGEELIVHRKGATPAGIGESGVIPGSMATPAYLVMGKGDSDSISSASHGAGRAMSRKAAKETFTWGKWSEYLDDRRVRLLSGTLDEVPGAYKDIVEVMLAQVDLVHILGSFLPKIVRMHGGGRK